MLTDEGAQTAPFDKQAMMQPVAEVLQGQILAEIGTFSTREMLLGNPLGAAAAMAALDPRRVLALLLPSK